MRNIRICAGDGSCTPGNISATAAGILGWFKGFISRNPQLFVPQSCEVHQGFQDFCECSKCNFEQARHSNSRVPCHIYI